MAAVFTTHHTRHALVWEVHQDKDKFTGQEVFSLGLIENVNNCLMIAGLSAADLEILIGELQEALKAADTARLAAVLPRDCDAGLANMPGTAEFG